MLFKLLRIFFWAFVFFAISSGSSVFGQVPKGNESLYFKFQDGLYFSLEEFKSNQPTIKFDRNILGPLENFNVFKLTAFKFKQNDSVYNIKANQVMFACLDGVLYINHKTVKYGDNNTLNARFYKMHRVGFFCNYFRHTYSDKAFQAAKKVEAFTHVFVPAFSINVYGLKGNAPDQEYILSLKDDRIYNLKNSSKELKSLIMDDPYFQKVKIKNKELIIYLGQYNKRNLFNFGEEDQQNH